MLIVIMSASAGDQGSKGIRQWPINWCKSPMITITPSVDYNWWLKRLNTQNSIKVPKNCPANILEIFIIKLWGLV